MAGFAHSLAIEEMKRILMAESANAKLAAPDAVRPDAINKGFSRKRLVLRLLDLSGLGSTRMETVDS
jgi:hypothetical protein